MCTPKMIAKTLVIVGGLNWGLVGAFDFNLVNALFGSVSWLERLIYILVGLSAIMMCMCCKCKTCKDGSCKCGKGGGCNMLDKK